MFDLEQEIRLWRQAMSVRMPLRTQVVDELESHLRDAVQRGVQSGLTENDAWSAALRQLGAEDAIAAEYDKLPQPTIWFWMPAIIVLSLYGLFAIAVSGGVWLKTIAGRSDPLLGVHVWTISLGYSALGAIGIIAAWFTTVRALGGWPMRATDVLSKTSRLAAIVSLALTIIGVICGGVWLRHSQGRFFVLDLREMIGIGLVGWNAFVLWRLVHHRNESTSLVLGLVGGGLIGIGWMGPVFASYVMAHSSGSLVGLSLVTVCSLALLLSVLVVLAILPPGRLRFRELG